MQTDAAGKRLGQRVLPLCLGKHANKQPHSVGTATAAVCVAAHGTLERK